MPIVVSRTSRLRYSSANIRRDATCLIGSSARAEVGVRECAGDERVEVEFGAPAGVRV